MPALRSLRRSPFFSATVVVLLGLGIGAGTLIFTAVDVFLLRPLPVPDPERLARLGVEASATHITFDHSGVYARILARGRSFDEVFTCFPFDAAFASGRRVETVTGEVVSDNYFAALGLRPERGGFFGIRSGDALPAVISSALSRRALGGREDAIGSAVRIRGAAFTIAGVMAGKFGGLDLERRADVWVPLSAWRMWIANPDTDRAPARIFARLREGVTLPQAEAEVRVLYPAMVDADLAGATGVTPQDVAREKERRVVLASAARGVSAMRKQFSNATAAMLGAIAALLLIVAANTGGLMLARGEARRAETALRLSLGASRWAVARTLLAEALALAGAGAILGLLVAHCCGPLLLAFLPARRPLNLDLNPDLRVLAFAIAAAVTVAVVASLAPALHAVRTDLIHLLDRGGSRTTAPVSGRAVAAVQVALATVLAAGSVSLVRSLDAVRRQDPGFARERLLVVALDPGMAGVRHEEMSRTIEEVLRRARELPGTEDASLSGYPLMRGLGMKTTVRPAGERVTPADRLNVSVNYATRTHFAVMGMKLIAGRNLEPPTDPKARPAPAVVTASFARQFFPGADPVGREFGRAGPDGIARPDFRIAGVVQDVKYRGMREVAPPTFFSAFGGDEQFVTLYVRTRMDENGALRAIRAMLAAIGPGLAPLEIGTMEQDIETSLWQERLLAALSRAFAGLAALVAGSGLFGILAFSLSRRTREVGIRMAVGATRAAIGRLFAQYAGVAVAPGILFGCAAFALCRRALEPLLFGAGAGVIIPLAASACLLLLSSAAAVAIPVLRATRIEPWAALRDS